MISVLLVDDHPVVLRGLRDLFEAHADFTVLGQESDALQVVPAVKRTKPDILILDLMMPRLNGIALITQLRKSCPDTRVVVLSMHSDPAYVWEALHNGATGYVLKCSDSEELIQAANMAFRGRRYLSSTLSQHELERYAHAAQQSVLDPYDMLTNREKQVLQMSAEGNTNAQIAEQLNIGVRTAETHRANLLRKLDLHGQTELVRYAIKRGIIPAA